MRIIYTIFQDHFHHTAVSLFFFLSHFFKSSYIIEKITDQILVTRQRRDGREMDQR